MTWRQWHGVVGVPDGGRGIYRVACRGLPRPRVDRSSAQEAASPLIPSCTCFVRLGEPIHRTVLEVTRRTVQRGSGSHASPGTSFSGLGCGGPDVFLRSKVTATYLVQYGHARVWKYIHRINDGWRGGFAQDSWCSVISSQYVRMPNHP